MRTDRAATRRCASSQAAVSSARQPQALVKATTSSRRGSRLRPNAEASVLYGRKSPAAAAWASSCRYVSPDHALRLRSPATNSAGVRNPMDGMAAAWSVTGESVDQGMLSPR
ncbi:hypothetical protein ACWEPL_37635 [Nonomuraea sp. NPDC004186]